jgi:hypothetical protein
MTSAKELLHVGRCSRNQHISCAPSPRSATADSLYEDISSRRHKNAAAQRNCYIHCPCLPTIRSCRKHGAKPKPPPEPVDCAYYCNEFKHPRQTCDSSGRSSVPSIDSKSAMPFSTERKKRRPVHHEQLSGSESNAHRTAKFHPAVLKQFEKKRREIEQRTRREDQILLDKWTKERAARRQAAVRKKPPFPAPTKNVPAAQLGRRSLSVCEFSYCCCCASCCCFLRVSQSCGCLLRTTSACNDISSAIR